MFNEPLDELVVAKVVEFGGSTDGDKNRKPTWMLRIQAGKWPNRNTVSSTVLERAGFELGKTYLVQVTETGEDAIHGRQFNWLALKEVEPIEVVALRKDLGKSEMIFIDKPEASKGYQRKTNVVEGAQTRREKAGLFTPAYRTTEKNHSNAREVVYGTSVEDSTVDLTPQEALKNIDSIQKAGEEKNKVAEKNLKRSIALRRQHEGEHGGQDNETSRAMRTD